MCGALCSTVLRLVEHFNFVTVHHSADGITVLYAFWLCIINLNVNCTRYDVRVHIVPFRQSFPFYNHSTTASAKLIILHHSLSVTTAVILFSFVFLLCASRSVDAECEYCVQCTLYTVQLHTVQCLQIIIIVSSTVKGKNYEKRSEKRVQNENNKLNVPENSYQFTLLC